MGLHAIADSLQIGNQVRLIPGRKPEPEGPVEVTYDLVISIETSIMEVRRVEIGIQQRRRLVETARANIVRPVIDERTGRKVASCAAETRVARERPVEQGFAAPLRRAGIRRQFSPGRRLGLGRKSISWM